MTQNHLLKRLKLHLKQVKESQGQLHCKSWTIFRVIQFFRYLWEEFPGNFSEYFYDFRMRFIFSFTLWIELWIWLWLYQRAHFRTSNTETNLFNMIVKCSIIEPYKNHIKLHFVCIEKDSQLPSNIWVRVRVRMNFRNRVWRNHRISFFADQTLIRRDMTRIFHNLTRLSFVWKYILDIFRKKT